MRPYVATAFLAAAVALAVAGTAPASAKEPFTITNDPIGGTVVDTMLRRTCSGAIVPIWWAGLPHFLIQAVFSSKPDGTKWVDFSWHGKGPMPLGVTELGVSAQWNTPPERYGQKNYFTHWAVWPDGDNRLSGLTVDPWGTIDLACE